MGSEYKASEKGKKTARIDDVDLYNLMAIRRMGKREREINRALGRGMSQWHLVLRGEENSGHNRTP
jgi:hypothetical protein